MAGTRRRKIDLYGCAGISAVGEVWLMRNAPRRGGRRPKGREKKYEFFSFALKREFLFRHPHRQTEGIKERPRDPTKALPTGRLGSTVESPRLA